ncbi:sigma 54-interacting transcriptional regulator [Bacillus sp. REN10]|uniref:sigma 54-interacting transcriptional regulator n=1 Tax=Bacillus sp. REN10 TaxID=2782541 RepID=UPI00193C4A62|nr:sigma 54-interacting transcriptional regulator [Bacillus sp. REN10]
MRWKWKEVLKPLPLRIGREATVQEVIQLFNEAHHDIAFVFHEGKELVGYITPSILFRQLEHVSSFDEPIHFEKDVLFVRETSWVEFWHHCELFVGVDAKDEIVGYATADQAKQTVSELQLALLNQSINSAEMGIITTNDKFEVNFMNETAEQILGLPRSILINRNYKTIMETEANLDNILAGERKFGVACSFNFKKIMGHFSPIDREGRIQGMVHVFYLQQLLEEAVSEMQFVRELSEELQAIYAASNEQIMVTDPSGMITSVAGAFLQSFWKGFSQANLIGQNVNDLAQQGLLEPNIVDLCMKEKQRISLAQHNRYNSKVLSTATPVYKEGELQKVIVLSRDVTADEPIERRLLGEEHSPVIHKKMVYRSKVMTQLVEEIKQVAAVDSTVIITGESGVGKEVIASHIHAYSNRATQPFVTINCGAIPENLLESELFGHEKGAFTSASDRKKGLFEAAHGGTIFLDEISEIPLHMQVKLLRVLQEREVVRIGGLMPIPVNVRVLAATNRHLKKMVQDGTFREDLFYRLHVVPLAIPPLRKRKDDIAPLSLYFLKEFNAAYQKEKKMSREGLQLLESYQWPGNIRELQNVMERLVVTSKQAEISGNDVFRAIWDTDGEEVGRITVKGIMPLKEAVEEIEHQLIQLAVGKYGTAAKASSVLGVSASTISRRMKKTSK